MCNFRAPNLFSLYLCIQPSNGHKFKWFRFVWFSSFAECINYSVIIWNKILLQRLLFSHCSPSSSLVSAHINCRTFIYCYISASNALCAEEFMKFCAELTEIDVFTRTHKCSQPPSSFFPPPFTMVSRYRTTYARSFFKWQSTWMWPQYWLCSMLNPSYQRVLADYRRTRATTRARLEYDRQKTESDKLRKRV